jgi:hypothetical protein
MEGREGRGNIMRIIGIGWVGRVWGGEAGWWERHE